MAHYAYIYFRNANRSKTIGVESNRVEIVVPTGACGNITGAFITIMTIFC